MASHYLRVVIPFGFAAVSAIGIGSATHNSERAIISSFGQNFKSKLEAKIDEADRVPEAEESQGSEVPQIREGTESSEVSPTIEGSQDSQTTESDDYD